MAPVLDHTAFPHILDRVLALSSWTTKIYLRCLSRSLRDRIDADLFHHLVLYSEDRPSSYDVNRSPPGITHLEIFAPGARPLPPVRWKPGHTLEERMDAMRKLSYVRIVDWGLHMDHPILWGFPSDKQRSALELAAQTQSLVPLLGMLTNVEVVRYDDGHLAPLGAKTHVTFDNFVSMGPDVERGIASQWLHWGDGILLLPAGVEKLILHCRYDPRHPNLDRSFWDLDSVLNYPLRELVILPRPTKDLARDIAEAEHLREEPVLGFLDDLFKWAMVLCSRGAKVTFVGLDTMPAANLRFREEDEGELEATDPTMGAASQGRGTTESEAKVAASRTRASAERRSLHIARGITKLAAQGIQQWQDLYEADFPYGHDEDYETVLARLRLISWAEYAAETPRDEYALAMVRPGFRSLPQRDFLGFPWRDDEMHIYPRTGRTSHLDWLDESKRREDGPPPLSPRPRPLDGDRAVRVSKFRAGGEGELRSGGANRSQDEDEDEEEDESMSLDSEAAAELGFMSEDDNGGMAHGTSDNEL